MLRQYPDTPRSRGKEWILAGRVHVDGVTVRKPHQVIGPQEKVELQGRLATTLSCGSGWAIHPRVSILFLDASLAVVNKGPGLISVPSPEQALSALSILEDFLAGRLKAQDRQVAQKTLPPAYRRLQPLPVHRLDQYTSGVFCMATNPAARHSLIEQLRAHTMQRQYVAFAEGRAHSARGTWRNWLQLTPDEMQQHVVTEGQRRSPVSPAQEAITHYEVLAEYRLANGGYVTKLRLRLETGRKHQIRAKAAHSGLPLIGDRKYNPGWKVESRHRLDFPRQALHAETLTLEHPTHHQQMTWTAPFPKDLCQLEALVKRYSRGAFAGSSL